MVSTIKFDVADTFICGYHLLAYMPNGKLKKKFTDIINIKINCRLYGIDWKLWLKRSLWYLLLLVVVSSVCRFLFDRYDLYSTYADSARYMLSAMVQAQAAVIAIIITMTLIAVQLTASAYSTRVVDVFKKILICGYFRLFMLCQYYTDSSY